MTRTLISDGRSRAIRLPAIQNLSCWLDREVVFGRFYRRGNLNFEALEKVHPSLTHHAGGGLRSQDWWIDNGALMYREHPNTGPIRFGEICNEFPLAILGRRDCELATYFLYPFAARELPRLMYVLVTSQAYRVALDRMLPALLSIVRPEQVWITVAGSSHDGVVKENGVTYSHLPLQAYEYLGPLDFARRGSECDYIFLLHDTCLVGAAFERLVLGQPFTLPFDYMSVVNWGQFNMGLYRLEFLRQEQKRMEGWVGMSKLRSIELEYGSNGDGFKNMAAVTTNFLDGRSIDTGYHQPYSATRRRGAYLPGADIQKFYFYSPAPHPERP
jgi:hypothetical protein